MKVTQYKGEVFNKNGEEYTKFTIGVKATKPLLEKTIIAFGGQLVKETRIAKYYELKGNHMRLMVVY